MNPRLHVELFRTRLPASTPCLNCPKRGGEKKQATYFIARLKVAVFEGYEHTDFCFHLHCVPLRGA